MTTALIRKEYKLQDGFEYFYTLCESLEQKCYKVSIVLNKDKKVISENSITIECDKNDAIAFFDKLVANLATPLNLVYVAEDELTV